MSQRMSILTDVTLCTGCEACVEGCKKENNLGKDVPRRWKLRIDVTSSHQPEVGNLESAVLGH